MPKVSVVMSVYNGERYLRQAVDSILSQSFRDLEFIIIDDGSTDGSADIMRSYDDGRIRMVSQENTGLTRSLNRGIKLATGQYIARQDADDISELYRIEKQVAVLENTASAVLVSGNLRYFSEAWSSSTESNRDVDPLLAKWLLLFYNHIGGHSQVMFKKDILQRLNGYDERIRFSQDYELWLRMSGCGDVVILPDVLLNFRHHDSNVSKTAAEEQLTQSLTNSLNAIKLRSGVSLTASDIKVIRRFWLNYGEEISATEAESVDNKLEQVLNGLVTNSFISPAEKPVIARLVSMFCTFNGERCRTSPARETLGRLALKWNEASSGANTDKLDGITGKFI